MSNVKDHATNAENISKTSERGNELLNPQPTPVRI